MIFNRTVASTSVQPVKVLRSLSPTSQLIFDSKSRHSRRPSAEWADEVRKKIGDSLLRAKMAPAFEKQIAELKLELSALTLKEYSLSRKFDELAQVTEALRVENERLRRRLAYHGLDTQVVSKRNRLDAVAHELYK